MADQLMELARELKTLNARRKGGEALSPDEDKRRKELKKYLKAALSKEKGGGTSEGGAVSGMQTSMESSAPKAPPAKKPAAKKPAANPYAIGGVDDLLGMAAADSKGPSEDDEFATSSIDDGEAEDLGMSMDDGGELHSEKVPGNKTKKDYSNAFAVDASNLFDNALGSENVQAAAPTMGDPTSKSARAKKGKGTELRSGDFAEWLSDTSDGRAKMRNDGKAIEAIGLKADEAAAANKTRDHVTKPEDVKLQLGDIMGGSGYTPPESQLAHEQYYGEYVEEEGFGYADLGQALDTLKPIDPREIELHRAGVLADENDPSPVPAGLAFLDDFMALYELGVVPPASEELNFDSDDPNLLIPGKRKVTVHLLNGQVKRGAIRTLARDDMGFRLEPTGTGKAQDIPLQHIKAIFVHMPSNATPREINGRQITVMFKDRRSVAGVSDDYAPGATMFSLIPPAGRGAQFERIIVNPQSIKQVR